MRFLPALLALLLAAGCSGSGSGNSAPESPAGAVNGPVDPPGSYGRPPAPILTAASTCDALIGNGRALPAGMSNDPVPGLARPAKGVPFADPTYGSCVVRATDHAVEPPSGFARNDYSRRQAFNADSSRLIVYSQDGFWHLFDATSLGWIRRLDGPAGDAEPQWHPTDPARLQYLPTSGVGMTLLELNVDTGETRVLADFRTRLRARWPSANAAWTRSEGSPSADGRFWCFMVDDAAFRSLGLFTWDRDTDTILGFVDTQGDRPDHVSMSPSGGYCVSSSDSASGTRAWPRDLSASRLIHSKSEHSDLAFDLQGDDVYVSVDYQSASGDLFMVNLRTGVRTALLPTYVAGSATALHVSGKAFARPGWVLVSAYGDYNGQQWLHRKLFAVQLAAGPAIHQIAHHHSVVQGYWPEPQATVNRDFTRLLFNSNWDRPSETDVDAYLIALPANALP